MPRTKDICDDLREAINDAHQSGKSYKAISKQYKVHCFIVRMIIYKWGTFKTVASLPRSGCSSKFTPRLGCMMLREIEKDTTSRDLRPSVSMVNKLTIPPLGNKLNKYGIHEMVASRKTLLSKKNIAQHGLSLLNSSWMNPKTSGRNSVFWTDETKVDSFGCNAWCHVWWKPNTTHHSKNLMPTVKNGGWGVVIWGCFTTKGSGHFAIIESTLNSSLFQRILEEGVRPSDNKSLAESGWCNRSSMTLCTHQKI